MTHYFASDGNWGDAEEIQIVDTDRWTKKMWEVMSDQPDWAMPEMAKHFNDGYHPKDWERKGKADFCRDCGLTRKQRNEPETNR